MRLFNGDCYKLVPDIADKSIDLVITDPPYQFGRIHCSGMFSERNYARFGRKRNVKMLYDLEKLGSVVFEPQKMLDMLVPKMRSFYGYFFCNKTLVADYINWAKGNGCTFDILALVKSNPMPAHSTHHLSDMEYIVLIRGKSTYFQGRGLPLDDYRKHFSTACRKRIHPAEKPVELLERFVRVSCPEGGTVLDPFMGSGSTAIAALKNGREFIGIEKDAEYFDVAKKRVDEYNGVGGLFDFSDMENAV